MELHALGRELTVANRHHDPAPRRADLKAVGDLVVDDQRVVAADGERRGQSFEDRAPVVLDRRRLPVHRLVPDHGPAERLCQRIAIFKTRLITLDTPAALRQQLFGRKVVFHLKETQASYGDLLKQLPFVKEVQLIDNKILVSLDDPEEQNPLILRKLVEAGALVQFVGELRHSLEDVYMQMIHSANGGSQ